MPMINVGASVEAVKAARDAIKEILSSGYCSGDNVKIAALETFRAICEVKNTHIEDCTFDASVHNNNG